MKHKIGKLDAVMIIRPDGMCLFEVPVVRVECPVPPNVNWISAIAACIKDEEWCNYTKKRYNELCIVAMEKGVKDG